MPVHPAVEDLIAYAEEPRKCSSRRATEEHLRTCRRCVLDVAALRDLRDLELEGQVIQPSDRVTVPSQVVSEYLKRKTSGADKVRAGFGLLAGVVTTALGGLSLTPEPALGETDSTTDPAKIFPPDVRSGEGVSSFPVEDEKMPTASHFEAANPIIGTPHDDAQLFPGKQGYADTCAVRCQEYIIRQYTGLDLPERFYVDEAKAHGWYRPGIGTYQSDIGKLLEYHHIPVHRYQDANIYHLTSELAQGHKVIVGVHAEDLWSSNWLWREIRQALGFSSADHAVVVTGIDTHDPDHPRVIVSDPGNGKAALSYPMEKFLPAWGEGHFFMVSTQEPPPAHMELPEMENFDYHAGHLHHIGHLAYSDFEHMALEHESHAHGQETTHHHDSQQLLDRITHVEDREHSETSELRANAYSHDLNGFPSNDSDHAPGPDQESAHHTEASSEPEATDSGHHRDDASDHDNDHHIDHDPNPDHHF